MSVVNKVLRDLDARQAGANERIGLPSAVTPLSVHLAKKRPVSLLIAGVASLAVAAGASIWILRPAFLFKPTGTTAPTLPVAQAPKPIAAAPAAPPVPSPPAPPAPVPATPMPPMAAPSQPPSAPEKPASTQVAETPGKSVTASASKEAKAKLVAAKDKVRTSGYFVQIGAFSNRGNAVALGEQLQRDLGDLAEKVQVFQSGRLTVVQMGPWGDAAEARRVSELLRSKHGIASSPLMKPQQSPADTLLASGSAKGSSAESSLEGSQAVATPVQDGSAPAAITPAAMATSPTPADAVTSSRSKAKGKVADASKAAASPSDGHIDKQPRQQSPTERAEASYRRGIQLHRQGQLDDAAALFRASLEDHPDHAAARQALAGLLIDTRRFDEAESVLRKGMEINSLRLPSVQALARLKVERNQVTAALEVLQQNADVGEKSAEFQGFTGALLNRLGRYREASDRYQAATLLAPNESRWWAALGIALEAQGRGAEARDAYMKAKNLGGLPSELDQHIDQRLR